METSRDDNCLQEKILQVINKSQRYRDLLRNRGALYNYRTIGFEIVRYSHLKFWYGGSCVVISSPPYESFDVTTSQNCHLYQKCPFNSKVDTAIAVFA
jgi:hypothetical protein